MKFAFTTDQVEDYSNKYNEGMEEKKRDFKEKKDSQVSKIETIILRLLSIISPAWSNFAVLNTFYILRKKNLKV